MKKTALELLFFDTIFKRYILVRRLYFCVFGLLLLATISAVSVANAQLPVQQHNPYNIGPEGRTVEDLRDFAKPNQMFEVLPNRPVTATDSSGNRQYYTPSGQMSVSISKDGHVTFNLANMSKTVDAQGNIVSTEENIAGTNMKVVKNEFGETISYKETGFGGNIVKEYDKDKNLTKSYTYDTYGKNLSYVTDEMTKGRTVFEHGLAKYDEDFEGNRTAVYQYDANNRLALKTDMYGNKTHYDDKQNVTYTENKEGLVIARYSYEYDQNGNYVLLSSYDPSTRETTFYKNGKQQYTKNASGAIITDYMWNGSKLIYTFNRTNHETTWYDIDGKTLYTTYDNELISKNLYYKGQLVGIWDVRKGQVTIFKNERKELVLQLAENEEPTAEDVKIWIDMGLVELAHLTSEFGGALPALDLSS
ncbi:MAG: hypothetical protein LBH33_01940 [Endomicrobium sp.]|jgi:hypothetical protein|nr:hypothetical protein [Endomicrobium sp.]